MGKLIITQRDYDREVSNTAFPGSDLTAANIVAELAEMTALVAAVAGISEGSIIRLTRIASVSPQEDVPATSQQAHRERKWMCFYHDGTTFEKATLSIPCADASLLENNTSELDLTVDPGLAFKTAFETYVLPPGGNTAVLDRVLLVGRNT